MIDRARFDEISARCATGELHEEDLRWLVEQVERLAADNVRLSRLVADITEMVRDAKRRRFTPIVDDIGAALDRKGDPEDDN